MEAGSGSGNFSFLGSCRYAKGLYLISISNGATLLEIFQSLGRKCNAINPELTVLQYIAPHEKIAVTLNEDDDVRNMINLHICLKLNMISLRAVAKDDQSQGNINAKRFDFDDDVSTDGGHELEVCTLSNSVDSWVNCIRGDGQTFKDAAEFRICLKNYAIATRKSFSYRKNESEKILVVCSEEKYQWKIYVSKHKSDNSFGIRKCNLSHSCGDDNLRTRDHPKANASWVANLVKEKLRGEPSYRPCTMMKDLQRDYGVELEYHRVWAGKEMAMHDIHGTDEGSYDKLRWYCQNVKETNPGSFVECEIDPMTQKFRRLFICFHACLVGFISGCRPLIFLDGTHIKNKYKGCLLVTVAKDANDDIFTLAYAVVDAENDSNWEWFCYHLKNVLASQYIMVFHRYTFFSDRHPGLIKAIQSVFPGSYHSYCLRHLVDNFVKQVLRRYPLHNKKHWSSVLKKAAYTPLRHEFTQHIKSITDSMPLAQDFLVSSSPENWANSLFLGERWGVINNNIVESWNNWVKPARHLPIVAMVDNIRIQIMTMMQQRREKTLEMTRELSPRKQKDVSIAYGKSRTLKVLKSCGSQFEIVDGDKTFAVDLNSWVRATTNPIPTSDMNEGYLDDGLTIYAPTTRSQPGRRRTKRIPSQVEQRVKKHKSLLNQESSSECCGKRATRSGGIL
ncbi:uncharacterized protein [Henckelia pumila]|uniref:uncharacterized protein n=1 Tax=Henckelia pumila TaxID=405737 RepID=UPI003C6E0065